MDPLINFFCRILLVKNIENTLSCEQTSSCLYLQNFQIKVVYFWNIYNVRTNWNTGDLIMNCLHFAEVCHSGALNAFLLQIWSLIPELVFDNILLNLNQLQFWNSLQNVLKHGEVGSGGQSVWIHRLNWIHNGASYQAPVLLNTLVCQPVTLARCCVCCVCPVWKVVLVPVCSSWMNIAEGPFEECPGDPTHRRHKQKPKGPQGGGDGTTESGCVCVCACVRVCVHVCVCPSITLWERKCMFMCMLIFVHASLIERAGGNKGKEAVRRESESQTERESQQGLALAPFDH